MGCVLGKASDSVKYKEDTDSPIQRELRRKASELRLARVNSSKRNESFSKERFENVETRIGLVDKKLNGSRKVRDDYYDMKRESSLSSSLSSSRRVPRAIEGEQIAAGWPCWLVAVAREAIKGWIPRRADTFERLNKIGQGTYSSVYKGRDLVHNKVVALKKVRFDNMDPESVKFMAREILILRRLDHPNIIKLEGLVASKTSASLYLVFEYMEHDLTGIASLPGVKFTEPQVKCYMEQLLSGLDHCHSHGVLHRDIKGSNLLIDNQGILKIADFGLASHFDDHNNVPLTSRVVTLWYRPPELLLGATKYGVAVDLWSTGCILGELYARKPIMPGRTEVEQLHKIFKLCGSPSDEYWRRSKLPHSKVYKPAQPYKRRIADTFKNLPEAAIQLIETLLSVDPLDRGSAASALNSQFFQTKPLACDPSSLPKYPPSKEIDAKQRQEEKRRQGSIGVNGQNGGNDLKRTIAPTVNFNAELSKSMQRRQGEAPYVYSINQPISSSQGIRETSKDRIFHSGPLAQQPQWRVSTRKLNNNNTSQSTNQVRILSESFTDRRNHVLSESFGDRRDHTQIFSNSQQTEEHIKDNQLGNKEKTIHFSGPLVPSNNIEQVLREHDRRIQEATRRLKHEKARGGGRVRPHEMYLPSN